MNRQASGAFDAAGLRDEVFATLDRLTEGVSGTLGVALSGGSDSTALTLLASEWAKARGRIICAATVDHHLRPGSTAEAGSARAFAEGLGLAHSLLDWDPGDRDEGDPGNLSARAREARHRLLGDWAARQDLGAVLLGHTIDDQAETVLMRLMRGSGADGLSAMAESIRLAGTLWLRPLLRLPRAALRERLVERGIGWSDDPTNEDPRYDRVAVRKAMSELGIKAQGLAATAETLARQRRVLEQDRDRLAADAVRIGHCGELILSRDLFERAEEDTRLAVLADALCWLGGHAYRPRIDSLRSLWNAEGNHTLGGVISLRTRDKWTLCREPSAVSGPAPIAAEVWDHRWSILPGGPEGFTVAATGEAGLSHIKQIDHQGPQGWAQAPRPARLTVPAIWRGETLIAVPAAKFHDPSPGHSSAFSTELKPLPARFGRCERL
ncbi:MAG: tRNA lysidine(34) synthetase TilS [Pseudomonadota bacterium]